MARILVVDDDDSVRSFVVRAMAAGGHDVEQARDGARALERLAAEPFDLLLSDIRMPVMDGIALAHAARRAFPSLPILLMTGYADQRERADDLAGVVDDVLIKPFTLATIREAVRRLLPG